MTPAYPGEIARRRCADRTRIELLSYQPARPLALRDELRLRGMAARCSTCRACPGLVRTLAAMDAGTAPAPCAAPAECAAVVLRLAS
ncbi:MAG: hypothetical protein JWQ97_2539 [Phenylobacterium sp.]|jgi:hypothetical protein|nr:hypothetical protein [Phenylobacterium sp.]